MTPAARARNAARPRARAGERLGLRLVQTAAAGTPLPLSHYQAVGGEAPPATAVGLVVLVGDDDLIAGLEEAAEGPGEHIGVLRGRRAELNLAWRDAQVLREARARRIHPLARLRRRRKGVVGLDLEAPVVLAQAAHHRTARVRAAGVLEECLAGERGLGERRKLASNELEIQRHRRVLAAVGFGAGIMHRPRAAG